MAKDTANAHAYGDLDSGVWITDPGAAQPTTPTSPTGSPGADFTEVGWISEDGVTHTHERSTDDKRAWQGATLIRRIVTGDDHSFQFQCLEENAIVNGLRFPGATITSSLGITTTVVTPFRGQDLRSFVIDAIDGTVHKRFFIGRGEVSEFGDVVYQSQDLTVIEFTVTVYPDSNGDYMTIIDDNPALVAP